MNKVTMKKFTTQEIRDLYNRFCREEISFSEMVMIMNERVSEANEPQYKDGDFVYEDGRIMIVKSYPNIYHVNACPIFSGKLSYDGAYGVNFSESTFRYATTEEKQELIELLRKDGKQWNEEKKCVEDIPTELKEGDFVVGFGCIFILHTQIDKYSAQYHALYAKTNWNVYYYRTYSQSGNIHNLRLATESEKQELLDALAKKGKRWNAEELCIENIQVHKFKIGDKVRIKHGVSSKTHESIRPFFTNAMDELIGKVLTVEYCDSSEFVICDGYSFLKEWLEPYEGLKEGDFVVDLGCIFILHKQIDESSAKYHVFYVKTNGTLWYDKIYWRKRSINKLRLATDAEKQELLNALAQEGKRWNAEKRCVENIPKHKFKIGDKVRIKSEYQKADWIITHLPVSPDYIGKPLTVVEYIRNGYICLDELIYSLPEEWLEPYVEESKKDDKDIPNRKFKVGDKVRIKEGVSSKTHCDISPGFVEEMDKLIVRELIVENCGKSGFVTCDGYFFSEDWLEPYVEELKKGDFAIFWDDYKESSTIRTYDRSNESEEYFRHKDQNGVNWKNAIKFESKEQYEKLLKGEI